MSFPWPYRRIATDETFSIPRSLAGYYWGGG
jgi:hypothetical protein